MFNLHFFPATIGDAIWMTYGDPSDPHVVLIDGGTAGTRKHIHKKIKTLPEAQRVFELMVVSHIDKDHIGGILTMLERNEVQFSIHNEVWDREELKSDFGYEAIFPPSDNPGMVVEV